MPQILWSQQTNFLMPKLAANPSMAELKVAQKIAALRKDSSMTLKVLGQASGLSDAYLSRVENGKTAINIANLSKVAHALGVELSAFFESEKRKAPLILSRAGEGKKIRFRSRHGIQARLLADEKRDKLMEPIWLDISSAKTKMPLQSHSGQEFIYILKGRCRFSYAKELIELTEGDSILFDSNVDHAAIAIPGVECQAITVVTSRDYHFHGDIVRLLDE